jgi:predicted RND superfamily exporter protein
MISWLMRRFARIPIRYPRALIIGCVALTAVMAIFIPRLHISTDRNLLSGTDNPVFKRREAVNEMFGTALVAVVVVSGDSLGRVRAAADDLARSLAAHEEVRDVFYRADVEFFERHALMFASEKGLEELVSKVSGESERFAALGRAEDLAALIDLGVEELEDYEVPTEVDPGEVETGLDFIDEVLTDLERWFGDPPVDELGFVQRMWEQGPSMIGDPGSKGYLTDNDGQIPRLAVLFVQPADDSQSMDVVAPLTDLIRADADRVLSEHPGLSGLVTGMPALATDELRLVSRDAVVAGLFAGLGVLMVFVFAFRSLRISVFVLLPLAAGLTWATGLAGAVYGHLTLITGYFAAVLFGLGVPFTLHIVARFHEALRGGSSVEQAVEAALIGAGPGVVVGGATTALAFAAIAFSEFQGFAELGVIAGAGTALILLANLTLLPATLLLWHPGAAAISRAERSGAFWVSLARSRFVLPILGGLALIAGLVLAPRIGFDYAVESMLPAESDAVKGMRLLDDRTEFASTYSVAVADSQEAAEKLRLRLEALPTVARAEAVSQFVPTGQDRKIELLSAVDEQTRAAVREASRAVDERRQAPGTLTAERFAEALRDLGDNLQDLAFDAKRAGRPEAVRMGQISSRVGALSKVVGGSGDDERTLRLQRQAFDLLSRGFGVLGGGLEDPGFDVDDLPVAIRGRYVSKDAQKFAVIAFPTDDLGERSFLWAHADELESVDPGITGHPVTHRQFTMMVFDGFFEAVLLAGIAVLVLILLDLRSPRWLALAIVPVAAGAGWTALVLYLSGFKMNYGNLMALPILIGAGVDYGAHLAHRARQEGSVLKAARTTGRTIALSGLTTLIGFGALILGNHWGVRSLGLLLMIGIIACLITALVVLPGLLRRDGSSAARREPNGGRST